MADDTNTLQYWLNWRAFTCEILVLLVMLASLLLIWRYERPASARHNQEIQREKACTVYADASWRPCLKQIHPVWLLAFRIFAFSIFWAMFIISLCLGATVFYFYTEWTLIIVTIYFGLGSMLSINGCYQFMNTHNSVMVDSMKAEEEGGSIVTPSQEENRDGSSAAESNARVHNVRKLADIWGYTFQIIYQTSAGAAMFTDIIYWLFIYPTQLDIGFWETLGESVPHSLNVIFLLIDAAMNSVVSCVLSFGKVIAVLINLVLMGFQLTIFNPSSQWFPFFRISYFVLLTAVYIILQWIIHACFSLRWPYYFLDLSPSVAPVRYLILGLLLVPSYTLFFLIIKLKHYLLLRWFPQSYQFHSGQVLSQS